MDVTPPGPTSLVIVLETNRIDDFPAGGTLVIRGNVKYNTAQGAPAPNVRVFLDDPVANQKYQVAADGLGAFQFPPRIGPSFFGQYDYILTAQDDELGIETTNPVKLTVFAVKVEEEQEDKGNWLLWVVVAVVIAVAIIGGTLGYWAFSSKGRMVECGECGTLVPDNATECPKCGIEFEVEVAKCSECESWIRSDADTCPYCGTPFRDLEGVEGAEDGPQPPEDAEDAEEVHSEVDVEEAPDSEPTDVGVVVSEEDMKASPEAAKQVPEGLKKEVRPRPVVQRKAFRPQDGEGDEAQSNGEGTENVVKPRVVRKVAAPSPDAKEAEAADGIDEEFDLKEDEEDL
jgi:RNA polymerase subunit RPABC4/transcription elongation factor Spt4